MNEKKYPIVNIGTASILTVFIILMMVTFATLTYMSAKKDAKYSKQSIEAATQYQNAVNKANQKIAAIDAELAKSYQKGTPESLPDKTYTFSIPISAASELSVTLVPCPPKENDGSFYRITAFKEVSTKHWKNDTTLNLMEAP